LSLASHLDCRAAPNPGKPARRRDNELSSTRRSAASSIFLADLAIALGFIEAIPVGFDPHLEPS
jgi:hypothetical protein